MERRNSPKCRVISPNSETPYSYYEICTLSFKCNDILALDVWGGVLLMWMPGSRGGFSVRCLGGINATRSQRHNGEKSRDWLAGYAVQLAVQCPTCWTAKLLRAKGCIVSIMWSFFWKCRPCAQCRQTCWPVLYVHIVRLVHWLALIMLSSMWQTCWTICCLVHVKAVLVVIIYLFFISLDEAGFGQLLNVR